MRTAAVAVLSGLALAACGSSRRSDSGLQNGTGTCPDVCEFPRRPVAWRRLSRHGPGRARSSRLATGQAARTSRSSDSATSAGGTWRVKTAVAPASSSGPTRSP